MQEVLLSTTTFENITSGLIGSHCA